MDWIKCTDRLPPEGQTVLCYRGIILTGFYQIDDCPYEKSKKGWNCDWWCEITRNDREFYEKYPITHWMPLPLPPKDEE